MGGFVSATPYNKFGFRTAFSPVVQDVVSVDATGVNAFEID